MPEVRKLTDPSAPAGPWNGNAARWLADAAEASPAAVPSSAPAGPDASPEEDDGPDDAYCSITNRIVIVSPLPQRIHELIRGLSAACYDVMVFHHGDPVLLSRLQADLLIADFTRPDDPGTRDWLASPELADLQIMRLVPPGAGDGGDAGESVPLLQLQWPAPVQEAVAAIRAAAEQSRRLPAGEPSAPSAAAAGGALRLHDLTLDLKRYTASVGASRLDLTKTEFDLLRALLEAGGSVLTRQELLDRVWGDDYFGGSNTVDVHVKTLRQKLGDDPRRPRYIVTVRGIGYRAADG